jgi:putative membrane protein
VAAAATGRLGAIRYPGLVVGIALFTGLVVYHGVPEIYAALAGTGVGILVIAAFHVIPLVLDAVGWWVIVPRPGRPPVRTFVYGRWLAVSINTLLPAMQVGGNVVRAQVLSRRGVDGAVAGASVVVDVTSTVLSQVIFAAMGVAVALALFGGDLARAALVGLALLVTAVCGFWLVQHRGLFGGLSRLFGAAIRVGDRARLTAGADALDAAVRALHRDRRAIACSVGWHLASWVVGSLETWLALRFLGHPMPVATALMVESLAQVVRSSAFAVPAALGVQEGGYLLLGGAIGLDNHTALALSLVRRGRDLVFGVPGLCSWGIESALLRWPRPNDASGAERVAADGTR